MPGDVSLSTRRAGDRGKAEPGSGPALLRAETSDRLSIAVPRSVSEMRSHTVSAEGGAAAVMRDNDSPRHPPPRTRFSGADFLATRMSWRLRQRGSGPDNSRSSTGLPWSRDPDGRVSVRPFGGMTGETGTL